MPYNGGAFGSGRIPVSVVAAEPMLAPLDVTEHYFMRVCTNRATRKQRND